MSNFFRPVFEDWSTFELAEYLVDKNLYASVEDALKSDRCDLLEECEDHYSPADDTCEDCGFSDYATERLNPFYGLGDNQPEYITLCRDCYKQRALDV